MNKVKIALVGAGNIANTHLYSYQKAENAEIYAICDIDEKRLNETADKFGINRRYTDLDAMLADLPELDAANVCVWNCNHALCSIKALNAGLNVLCEKPMAYSAKEAEEMLAAAKKSGKLLMIGFVCRFEQSAKIAADFIDKGYLGDIYYSKATYLRRHGNPGGWFCDMKRSGGGPVIDLGVHVIDLTRYLMGNPKPVSVYAVTNSDIGKRDYLKTDVEWKPRNASADDPCTVEDFASAVIRYDNGMEASGGRLKIVSLAPELSGAEEFIKRNKNRFKIAMGHTDADMETAKTAIAAGASIVTHTFNAMRPMHHRNPNMLGCAFNSNVFMELICDGYHVHPEMVKIAYKLCGKDRLVLITDSLCAMGAADGEFDIGGLHTYVKDGKATLKDGTIAGGTTPLYKCVLNAEKFGIPFNEAVKCASANPAQAAGIFDTCGSITAGKSANFLILNKDYKIKAVVIGGKVFCGEIE